MNKQIVFALIVIIASCGSKHPVPMRSGQVVKAQVSHYSDVAYRPMLLEKKTTLNFIAPAKDDLKTNALSGSVIQHCSNEAFSKGYPIMINSNTCDNCLEVKANTSNDTGGKQASFVNCFTDKNPNQQNCLTEQVKTYERWMQLVITDPKIKKQVHTIEATSEGPSDSIIKVSAEMCRAAFMNFPDTMVKKNYEIPYPIQK